MPTFTEVIFDIETKKIFDEIQTQNPADLGISIVCAYKRKVDDQGQELDGQLLSFWESDFDKLWPLFSNVDRIIGYNSKHFDVPALLPLCPYDLRKINHLDMLEKIKEVLGFRLSLDAVARETLGHTKTDVGLNAVLYWNQHTQESLAKLKSYCEADVLVTKDVYDYGLKHGHLKYMDRWNTSRSLPVDFSYPKPSVSDSQMGLF